MRNKKTLLLVIMLSILSLSSCGLSNRMAEKDLIGTWYASEVSELTTITFEEGSVYTQEALPFANGHYKFYQNKQEIVLVEDAYGAKTTLTPIQQEDGTWALLCKLDLRTYLFTNTPPEPAPDSGNGIHNQGMSLEEQELIIQTIDDILQHSDWEIVGGGTLSFPIPGKMSINGEKPITFEYGEVAISGNGYFFFIITETASYVCEMKVTYSDEYKEPLPILYELEMTSDTAPSISARIEHRLEDYFA